MAISRRWTIYEEQVPTPIDSPAHQGDFVVDVLEQLSVSEVGIRSVGVEIIPASMPFRELIHLVAQSTETLFPVVDAQGRLTGIFSLHDLRLALVGSEWGPLVLADDLAYRPGALGHSRRQPAHRPAPHDRAQYRRDPRCRSGRSDRTCSDC